MTQPEFQTERLKLSPWTVDDASELVRLRTDEHFLKFSNLGPIGLEDAVNEIRTVLVPNREGFGFWKVLVPELAGVMQLKNQTLDSGEVLPEMGYRLAGPFWGKGYATEAAVCLRDYALRELEIPQLHLFIDPNNERSQAVARRLGFKPGKEAKFKGFDIVIWSS